MLRERGQCTRIAEKMRIAGNISTEGTVEVNGEIDGEVRCTMLIVTRNARVTGKVVADSVVVDGVIVGPIEAVDVELKSQAHVLGDIACQAVVIERGACVEGRLLRSLGFNGGEIDEARLEAMEAARAEEAKLCAGAEESTRKAELVIEARHLSGNPNLMAEEALTYLAMRGNTQAKALLNGSDE